MSALAAWTKILTLAITYKPFKIEISYFICVFLSHGTVIFDLVTLTLKVFFLKNLNLGHNFQTRSDKAFILNMCIHCDKTFQWYHNL